MARILAVDDERAILDALARVLGRDGHEVIKAADPTAVPGTDLSRFDLVLCDVMMPGLDGFELVRQIRPDFDGPIIFLTARVAEEDAVAGYGLGADDYVRKPFGAAELRAKVAAHLRRECRPRSHALSFGEVRIDLGARSLAAHGEARSWICSTFMVITRNCSAFSSMTRAARSSASKVFSVSIPCRLSRNAAPISVYLPQYFLNTRAARIATMPTMSTMSGAQASSVAAVGRSIGASTANSVMGASTA